MHLIVEGARRLKDKRIDPPVYEIWTSFGIIARCNRCGARNLRAHVSSRLKKLRALPVGQVRRIEVRVGENRPREAVHQRA